MDVTRAKQMIYEERNRVTSQPAEATLLSIYIGSLRNYYFTFFLVGFASAVREFGVVLYGPASLA